MPLLSGIRNTQRLDAAWPADPSRRRAKPACTSCTKLLFEEQNAEQGESDQDQICPKLRSHGSTKPSHNSSKPGTLCCRFEMPKHSKETDL